MTVYTSRSELHRKKKSSKKWIWPLVILLIMLLLAGGFFIYQRIQDYQLQQKINAQLSDLITEIQQEQTENDLVSEEKEVVRKRNYSLFYLPTEQPLPFNPEHQLNELMLAERKKVDRPRQTLTVGSVVQEKLTEQLSTFHLHVDTYNWEDGQEEFAKVGEVSTDPIYSVTETGGTITAQNLIGSEEDLFGIQQVLQQKLLDESENPDEILDAVLDFPSLSFETEMTYTPDHLMISLPTDLVGVAEINLTYNEILPFIDQNFVDPSVITDESPTFEEGKKYVALTFDDGPNPDTTPELIRILGSKDVSATFFMLGQNAEYYPEIVKQLADEGHELASHSYSHPMLTTLDADSLKNEVRKTDRAIFQASGKLPTSLRPPYGAIDATSAAVIGKPIIQWDIDSYDWDSKNTEATVQQVKNTIHAGGIILMHDIHPSTVKAVGKIIDDLRQQGYEFVTVSQLLSNQEKPLYQYFSQNDKREIE